VQKNDNLIKTIVALLVVSAVFIVYIWDRIAVPVLLIEIRRDYDLSLPAAGLVASVFTFGLALTAGVAGVIVARVGMRTSLVASTILFSLSTGYIAFGYALPDLLVARVLGGVGEGIYIVSLLSYLGTITEKYRGAAMGLPGSLFGIGLFVAPVSLAFLSRESGSWQGVFYILMALGFAGAVAIGFVTRGVDAYERVTGGHEVNLIRLRSILHPGVIVLALIMGINGLGNYGIISLLIAYLRVGQNLDPATAGFIYGLTGLGAIIGGVPLGFLADKVGHSVAVPLLALGAGLSATILFSAPPLPVLLGALTLVFGVCANGLYVSCFALVHDIIDVSDGPLAIGLIATTYFLCGAFSGYILGAASGVLGWGMAGVVIYLLPYTLGALSFWRIAHLRRLRPFSEEGLP